jgi:ubiquinone/menaquinone biosynthesis C-methylase UbiE
MRREDTTMTDQTKKPGEYAFGHSSRELERLSAQARLYEPFTRQLLEEAGIAPGMRVLDVGCGHGDVAFLAARIVGPSGHVVAVDKAPPAVEAARARAASFPNVEVAVGDVTALSFDRPFDAVVGRLILMYCPDPVDALRKLAAFVKPGGLVIFQEFDLFGNAALPAAPLYEKCINMGRETLRRIGSETRMGLKLYPMYKAAGLPAPELRYVASIGGGSDFLGYGQVTEIMRSLLPLMERFGVTNAAELQLETLEARLRDEVVALGGVVTMPPLIGAFARKS